MSDIKTLAETRRIKHRLRMEVRRQEQHLRVSNVAYPKDRPPRKGKKPADLAARAAADDRRKRRAMVARRNYARCIRGNWNNLRHSMSTAEVLVARKLAVDLHFVKQYA